MKSSELFTEKDTEKVEELIKSLNKLLATYQVYYQNLRGLHWNIAGPEFFQLHAKFEELYTLTAVTIDDIAERILSLNGVPLHDFAGYLSESSIAPVINVTDGKTAIKTVYENNKVILNHLYQSLQFAQAIEDEGTITYVTDKIGEVEKNMWMFKAASR